MSRTSYSVISTGRDDTCVLEILQDLGISDSSQHCRGAGNPVAGNPFLMHAMVSGIAYNQSNEYLSAVRNDLMDQIKQVNDYSKESYMGLPQQYSRSNPGRKQLEDITKKLHIVSQTCDSGIANADMSIKLTEEMVRAYKAFLDPDRSRPEAERQVRDSLEWMLKTWHCQKTGL